MHKGVTPRRVDPGSNMLGHTGHEKLEECCIPLPGVLLVQYIGGGVKLVGGSPNFDGCRGLTGDSPFRGTVEDVHGHPQLASHDVYMVSLHPKS